MKHFPLQKSFVRAGCALTLAAVWPLAQGMAQSAAPAVAEPSAAASPSVAAPTPVLAPPPARPSGPPRTAETAVTPFNRNARRHAQFLYRIKEGPVDLLFLGDSITDFWPRTGEWSWLKFAPYHPANFGISGERTEDVLWRITNGELDGITPKVTVLMIGTNNIAQSMIDANGLPRLTEKPEWAAAGVTKIVETIHEKLPQTKVLLLAVFPRAATKDQPLRVAAEAINPIIAKLDDGNKTRYLDINHVFLTESGELTTDIMPDWLHPSPKGYDLWYDAMHPLLDEMMK